ncbi:hypothetical protein [Labrys sp. KB_33_2]|uniref:hypothetical protein n=1 Tax=Labrys sp. KB_33_2 TaxID=3237479 RepID=UPI003F8FBAB9
MSATTNPIVLLLIREFGLRRSLIPAFFWTLAAFPQAKRLSAKTQLLPLPLRESTTESNYAKRRFALTLRFEASLRFEVIP